MISIITPNGILGGFNSVVTYEDHYDAGGTLYYFDVIGSPHSLGQWIEPISKPAVPQQVQMKQAKKALLFAGHLSTVDAAIAALTGMQGDAARIDWATSTTVERNDPLVHAMQSVLVKTDAEIDALFIAASKL